eukprot:gene24059-28865_t
MITTVEAPFGGLKESGLGKEGGHQGIEDYLDTKYICVGVHRITISGGGLTAKILTWGAVIQD